jgi:hypothetical protein
MVRRASVCATMRTVVRGRWDVTTDPLAFIHVTNGFLQRRVRCAAAGGGGGGSVGKGHFSDCAIAGLQW